MIETAVKQSSNYCHVQPTVVISAFLRGITPGECVGKANIHFDVPWWEVRRNGLGGSNSVCSCRFISTGPNARQDYINRVDPPIFEPH